MTHNDYKMLITERLNAPYDSMPRPNGEADRAWQDYAIWQATASIAEKKFKECKDAVSHRIPTDEGKHVIHDSRHVIAETNNIVVSKPINRDLLLAAMIKHGISVSDANAIIEASRPPAGIQQRVNVTLKK